MEEALLDGSPVSQIEEGQRGEEHDDKNDLFQLVLGGKWQMEDNLPRGSSFRPLQQSHSKEGLGLRLEEKWEKVEVWKLGRGWKWPS